MPAMKRQIVLASSSPYRRQILERVQLSFVWYAPNIDESALVGESATDLVTRLSRAKAKAVAVRYPDALIIGADQVAVHGEKILGKPHNHADAVRQLQLTSGTIVTLYSGITLYNARTDSFQSAVEPFVVEMRELGREVIERYLTAEQPYDCCGSIKAEGSGIALLKRLSGDDPNALLGLPLIRLLDMLKQEGIELI